MRNYLILAAAVTAFPAQAASPAPLSGRWMNDSGTAVIEFAPCGRQLCGHIQRLIKAEPVGGLRDSKNPDKALRSRKLLGARVFWELASDGTTWRGQGYQPEDGRHFKAQLAVTGNQLKIKGCVALFCRTVLWKRTA